jgi:hypothetical protein
MQEETHVKSNLPINLFIHSFFLVFRHVIFLLPRNVNKWQPASKMMRMLKFGMTERKHVRNSCESQNERLLGGLGQSGDERGVQGLLIKKAR